MYPTDTDMNFSGRRTQQFLSSTPLALLGHLGERERERERDRDRDRDEIDSESDRVRTPLADSWEEDLYHQRQTASRELLQSHRDRLSALMRDSDTSSSGQRPQRLLSSTPPSPLLSRYGLQQDGLDVSRTRNEHELDGHDDIVHTPLASSFPLHADNREEGQYHQSQASSREPPETHRDRLIALMRELELEGARCDESDNVPTQYIRTDMSARNSLRELILSTILSESDTAVERVSILDDCKNSAQTTSLGIPFRDILSEPMDHLGVSPLMYEIMCCEPDWDAVDGFGLEMVLYLIDNWQGNVAVYGRMGICMNVVRTACLRRSDESEGNKLFQILRPVVAQSQSKEGQRTFDYEISISHLGSAQSNLSTQGTHSPNLGFTALIDIPHFATRLAQPLSAVDLEMKWNVQPGRKPALVSRSTAVPVEFIAARRAWRLEVDTNSLKLEILDGPDADADDSPAPLVDARVKIIKQGSTSTSTSTSTLNDAPVELFLPRARLQPITSSRPGPSFSAKLLPCFCLAPGDYNSIRDLEDKRLLDQRRGALLFELVVHIEDESSDIAVINVRDVPTRPTISTSGAIPRGAVGREVRQNEIDEDDLYVTSEVDAYVRRNEGDLGGRNEESEWEEVSQVDETESRDGGWVKASWSGGDEDL